MLYSFCLVYFYLLSEIFWVFADLDFMFHMFFLARYCKLLEENSFRGKTADFLYMLLFGASVLTGIVLIGGMIPYLSASFAKIIFLSNSLTFMMVGNFYHTLFLTNLSSKNQLTVSSVLQVYVWSKQNPYIHMSFLGLFTFTAAYLPWVSLTFSLPLFCLNFHRNGEITLNAKSGIAGASWVLCPCWCQCLGGPSGIYYIIPKFFSNLS